MTESTKRTGFDLRILLLIAVALVLGLIGAGIWALNTNNDLESTRATLASTSGDLDAAKGDLTESTATLDATTADLAAARDAIKKDQAKATSLNFQIERKGACIEAQTANLAEIRRILALERVNFARTGSTSAWGKAHAAEQTAINLAIDDLYKAYSAAFQGSTGTAKGHADKGRDAQAKIADAEQRLVAELKLVDSKAGEIQTAIDALETKLKTTEATCAGVAP